MKINIFEINQVPEEWKGENRVLIYCYGEWLSAKWMESKTFGWNWVCQNSGRILTSSTHAMLPPNPNVKVDTDNQDMFDKY